MAKRSTKSTGRKSVAKRPKKRKTLAELNAWLSANYDKMQEYARQNCLRLTGKPTFGGSSQRRKSA